MGVLKAAVIGASFASLALAHGRHMKRALPFDGTIITSCKDTSTIALTFDDGPYIYTQSIVDQLTAAGHQATFFQNGKPAQLEMTEDRVDEQSRFELGLDLQLQCYSAVNACRRPSNRLSYVSFLDKSFIAS